GSGIELAKAVSEKLGDEVKVHVYKNFGTALINYEDYQLEFVGARKESYRDHSRKLIVEDGSLEDDQNRRDLTINSLAIGLHKEEKRKLLDPFNGVEDLENKIIKTPKEPRQTFSDDPLRMMRAIRFASQLDFKIEENTYQAITANKERIEIVSQERITEELNKIIQSPIPSVGFKMLFGSGLLKIIFPEMNKLQGVDIIRGKAHKDNFFHTIKVLDNVAKDSDDLWLRWAAIMHDIAKPPTKRFSIQHGWTFHGHEDVGSRMVPKIFRKLKLPLDDKMKFVQKMVYLHLRPMALVSDEVSDSGIRRLIYNAGDDIDELMLLCKADITSKNEMKVKRIKNNYDKVKRKIKEVEEKDRVRNFQPPIRGEDIIKAFDLKPSPVIGDIKDAIKEAILEGEIDNNREDAWEYMLKVGKEKGLGGD
ncbi:MAG: CCA tRNA nucleotidyltransferase, partial [Flavobacteriales bacterium]